MLIECYAEVRPSEVSYSTPNQLNLAVSSDLFVEWKFRLQIINIHSDDCSIETLSYVLKDLFGHKSLIIATVMNQLSSLVAVASHTWFSHILYSWTSVIDMWILHPGISLKIPASLNHVSLKLRVSLKVIWKTSPCPTSITSHTPFSCLNKTLFWTLLRRYRKWFCRQTSIVVLVIAWDLSQRNLSIFRERWWGWIKHAYLDLAFF